MWGDGSAYEVPCAELDALAEELVLMGCPIYAERVDLWDRFYGWHLTYRGHGGTVSVIWSRVSSGSEAGLLEAWDYDERNDPKGWLTAGEVLRMYPPEVRP